MTDGKPPGQDKPDRRRERCPDEDASLQRRVSMLAALATVAPAGRA